MVKKTVISVLMVSMLMVSMLMLHGCGGGDNKSTVTWTTGDGGDGGGDNGGGGDGGGDGGGGSPSLDLSWTPVSTYADGSFLSPDHYRVYIGVSPGVYSGYSDTTSSSASISITGLASGTYYISITAFDAYGNEGDYSAEVIGTL